MLLVPHHSCSCLLVNAIVASLAFKLSRISCRMLWQIMRGLHFWRTVNFVLSLKQLVNSRMLEKTPIRWNTISSQKHGSMVAIILQWSAGRVYNTQIAFKQQQHSPLCPTEVDYSLCKAKVTFVRNSDRYTILPVWIYYQLITVGYSVCI